MSMEGRAPVEVLQEVFGYPAFRPLQEEAITNVLAGKDTLLILPTGGGKSICYQVPALIRPGVALVISPLIALMKDQVEALQANGIPAYGINSSVDADEKQRIHQAIGQGDAKLVYISPEKALSPAFLAYLETLPLSLIAIDETHCVSMWGNDFRPEYARLAELVARFPTLPVIALTATADAATREDIVRQLGLRNPDILLGSFARDNLHIRVEPASRRFERILQFLNEHPGEPGIIYCLSRKATEEVAAKLQGAGFRAAHYHAQMDRLERDRVQTAFQRDDLQIICATIAFGMGIDKGNIRWIIHYSLPRNVESYYQEIGRAGRDGDPAHTLLLAGYGDVITYRRMIESGEADEVFKEIQIAKLDRMFSLAQSTTCRSNVVLGYFGENRKVPCGHCDRCDLPVLSFDGTILAQMALSAVSRTSESVGLQLLVDILRGASTKEIREGGYSRIKTYGAGRHHSRDHWVQYVTQLIDRGLLAIDFTAYGKLRITPEGREVLFGQETVRLTEPESMEKKKARRIEKPLSPKDQFSRDLLLQLGYWRKRQSDTEGISPANLLGDPVLKALSEKMPLVRSQLDGIAGFPSAKRQRYGIAILQVVRETFLAQDSYTSLKGGTYLLTLDAVNKGWRPDEIARRRAIGEDTVYAHLAWLIEQGEDPDLTGILDEGQIRAIQTVWNELGQPDALTPVVRQFPSSVGFGRIRVALALGKREKLAVTGEV